MAKKEFFYRGKTIDELKKLSIKEFAQLVPARQRRTLLRGMPEAHQALMKEVENNAKDIKTHCRDFVILPKMVGMTIKVHAGKEWISVMVQDEMIGHRLGEFALTRKPLKHNAPGIGATKSSAAASVR